MVFTDFSDSASSRGSLDGSNSDVDERTCRWSYPVNLPLHVTNNYLRSREIHSSVVRPIISTLTYSKTSRVGVLKGNKIKFIDRNDTEKGRLAPHPYGYNDLQPAILAYGSRRLPPLLQETTFDVAGCNKTFASIWLNDEEVVWATKCNRMFITNIYTQRQFEIPLITIPDALLDSFTNDHSDPNHPPPRPLTPRSASWAPQGIHSLAMNPSKTLLAVGSGQPTEIAIYELPTFEPVAVLKGHHDMVFAVSWIDDETLVSGSRDQFVKMWKVRLDNPVPGTRYFQSPILNHQIQIIPPVLSRNEHHVRVRDLKFNSQTRNIWSLGTDGTVKIWDARRQTSLQVVSSIPLVYSHEAVCMELDNVHNICAVGSRSHVSLIDPRSNSSVHSFRSLDCGWGVRALCMHHEVMAVGGGLGRVSFYDLRNLKYLSWETDSDALKNPIELLDDSDLTSSTDTSSSYLVSPPRGNPRGPTLTSRFFQPAVASANNNNVNIDDDTTITSASEEEDSDDDLMDVDEIVRTVLETSVLAGDEEPETQPQPVQQVQQVQAQPIFKPTQRTQYLQTRPGWLQQDDHYRRIFSAGSQFRNTVYTLTYNPSGTRLFAGGGPLELKLSGCYAAVW